MNLDEFQSILESVFAQFRFKVNNIRLSSIANERLGVDTEANDHDEYERLQKAMGRGNSFRQSLGRGDALAVAAVDVIYSRRAKSEDDSKLPHYRTAHIVRSLKHTEEVDTLREIYGSGFFLLGITSSYKSRRNFLDQVKGIPVDKIEALIQKDDSEKNPLGQDTRGVFQLADAFISMDSSRKEEEIRRILDLIFGSPVVPPTQDEYSMFMAHSAALRSADLSRQVGAVIVSKHGDLLATGANDVPKAGGGLYWPTDDDQRDYVWGHDSNETQKEELILEIMKKVRPQYGRDIENSSSGELKASLIESGRDLLKDTGILDITEYGRAVHAEMEAIMSCARSGVPIRDTVLYTTTFPCHNCAKHIVAAGVNKVVYIEPYPKSFAKVLHKDSIYIEGETEFTDEKVVFESFVGISARKFIDLFSNRLSDGRKIKRKSELALWDRSKALPRVPMLPMSYIEKEESCLSDMVED